MDKCTKEEKCKEADQQPKQAKKKTAYDLERLFLRENGGLVKIDGNLYTPTDKHFERLNDDQLLGLIQRKLRSELEELGSTSMIKRIANLLKNENWINYPSGESQGFLGFENGILNTNDFSFTDYYEYQTKPFPILFDSDDWEALSVPSKNGVPKELPRPLITYHIQTQYMVNYMNLELYKGPYKLNERILPALSKFVKGEIEVDLLLCAYRRILLDYAADDIMLRSWYAPDILKEIGIGDESQAAPV